ncbi:MAG: PAS domain-containing protein, partial [bacterium]
MSWNASPSDDDQNIFPHGGRMGELIRSNDWSKTPIGPIEQWPQTLLTNLATILESPIPQFICWGRELTMVYNDAYIELLGDNHPALGKSLLEVWHEAKETIEPVIDKAFAGKSVFVENTQFTLMRHGYPEETCFDFTFSPLRDAHGTVVGLLNTTLEMTQCKEKLRESEERFSKAFHANPGPMVVSDIDTGRFIDSNAKWLKMLGYTREEIIGRTSVELGIWADPGHRPKLIKELRTKGSFSEVPTEFVTKSGEIRYALWSAEVIDYGG